MKGKQHSEESKAKISEGMKGNDNAEVWTEDEANNFAHELFLHVVNNHSCLSTSEAVAHIGQYDDLVSYLSNKYESVFSTIKKAKTIIKSRLIDKGLNSETNPTMTIFVLKNNHDMKDKVETENTHNISSVNLKEAINFDDNTES